MNYHFRYAKMNYDSDDDNIPLANLMLQNEVVDDENIPLIHLQRKRKPSEDSSLSSEDYYDSDKDPEYNVGVCEVRCCKDEVWAACHMCEILVCYNHFMEDIISCKQHGKILKREKRQKKKNAFGTQNECIQLLNVAQSTSVDLDQMPEHSIIGDSTHCEIVIPTHSENVAQSRSGDLDHLPEHFTVEGSAKEIVTPKTPKINKQKQAKQKRNRGEEYVSPNTKKTILKKVLKARCHGNAKCRRKCDSITDEQRKDIFSAFQSIGDLRLQREYAVRHIEVTKVKRRLTVTAANKKNSAPRRDVSKNYFLTVDGHKIPVCQKMFLNTLSVSEQMARTALSKLTETGTIEKDKRGGRQSDKVIKRDADIKEAVQVHINRFPRVESHYCRAGTNRQYLHSDLTKQKMYNMFCKEWAPKPNPPSFRYYEETVEAMQLSIHRPKKDQCSLCATVLDSKNTGDQISEDIVAKYERHIAEKNKVRELKEQSKQKAKDHHKVVKCATFDLQQVIYLPKSNESALFYKRRLSNFNLTFYDVVSKDCHCFTWHEGVSKRGSSEISTAVYKALKLYDDEGAEEVHLYSDGCVGQNKNSIMPAMMLYAVANSNNLQEISLRYFESFHGQNEGDSVHSAIATVMKRSGDLFVPSQLVPVFSLARRHQNIVHQLQHEDFLDFKTLSQDLRVLNSRKESEDGFVLWADIMELKVVKGSPDKIFYKKSHLAEDFSEISLKRVKESVTSYRLKPLNREPNKISKEKYQDLVSLCNGDTPVVRNREHKSFYLNLSHL